MTRCAFRSTRHDGDAETWRSLARCPTPKTRFSARKAQAAAGPGLATDGGMSLSLRACIVVASLGMLALGCTGQTKQESAATCDSDADCASGETCRHQAMPSGTPQVVAPNPCFNLINCSGGSSCPSGMVCAPYTPVNAVPLSGCPSMVWFGSTIVPR